jgi:hypothetical protein
MAENGIDRRLDRIEALLATLATRTDGIAADIARLARIEGRLEGIEHDITRLAEISAAMRGDLRALADRFFVQGSIVQRLEHRVAALEDPSR